MIQHAHHHTKLHAATVSAADAGPRELQLPRPDELGALGFASMSTTAVSSTHGTKRHSPNAHGVRLRSSHGRMQRRDNLLGNIICIIQSCAVTLGIRVFPFRVRVPPSWCFRFRVPQVVQKGLFCRRPPEGKKQRENRKYTTWKKGNALPGLEQHTRRTDRINTPF